MGTSHLRVEGFFGIKWGDEGELPSPKLLEVFLVQVVVISWKADPQEETLEGRDLRPECRKTTIGSDPGEARPYPLGPFYKPPCPIFQGEDGAEVHPLL
tara:strand:+ start:526 stop:822 length:297 start_codon:yes stop_codon:yes gene_type:complete